MVEVASSEEAVRRSTPSSAEQPDREATAREGGGGVPLGGCSRRQGAEPGALEGAAVVRWPSAVVRWPSAAAAVARVLAAARRSGVIGIGTDRPGRAVGRVAGGDSAGGDESAAAGSRDEVGDVGNGGGGREAGTGGEEEEKRGSAKTGFSGESG